MKTVLTSGKCRASAEVILDSVAFSNSSTTGATRLTTYELEYPRMIHSEFMTHRVFSRNAASSRAIKTTSKLWRILKDPAYPAEWGLDQPGMQAYKQAGKIRSFFASATWRLGSILAVGVSGLLHLLNMHKQIANRITEPFEYIKVVMSTTEIDNFLALRDHELADPTIRLLAKAIRQSTDGSTPKALEPWEWHLPYVGHIKSDQPFKRDLIRWSVAMCAQVSYRKVDMTAEKAARLYDRLIMADPMHASPLEHQAVYVGVPTTPPGNFAEPFRQLRHGGRGFLLDLRTEGGTVINCEDSENRSTHGI